MLSDLQKEYIRRASHRWNVKTGATRSGKTYLDVMYTIPARIRSVHGKPGLRVLLGATKGTLTRNIIEPLAQRWGASMVSPIRSDNTAILFGDRCYCLGADNVRQVNRLRGASVVYCYGDEVTTWAPEVFEMLKSRLDRPESRFDGTCNPESPHHWFKKFIDSDADVFRQSYTIDDNPFLDPSFVGNLKREYAGTVYYDRYISGLWMAAEGVIYRSFADAPDRFTMDTAPDMHHAVIGVDFGGNGSAHAFCCLGFDRTRGIVVLDEYYRREIITPVQLETDFLDFVRRCQARCKIYTAYCDSAETTLIRGLQSAALHSHTPIEVLPARKKPVNDRIRFLCRMMAQDRFRILRSCTHTSEALRTALWDAKRTTEDCRLDNGTTNIDSLDALEYAYERDIDSLLTR